jgi:hypothetical protein
VTRNPNATSGPTSSSAACARWPQNCRKTSWRTSAEPRPAILHRNNGDPAHPGNADRARNHTVRPRKLEREPPPCPLGRDQSRHALIGHHMCVGWRTARDVRRIWKQPRHLLVTNHHPQPAVGQSPTATGWIQPAARWGWGLPREMMRTDPAKAPSTDTRGFACSSSWTRTSNPSINSRMLCQLSYGGSPPDSVRRGVTVAHGRGPSCTGESRGG